MGRHLSHTAIMPCIALEVPSQFLPATPPPKRFATKCDEQISHPSSLLFSPDDTSNTKTEADTLSSYGDLSFSEGFIISSTEDSREPVGEQIQPSPRPRFRLKLRRPPMPKRRMSNLRDPLVGKPSELSRCGIRDAFKDPLPFPRFPSSNRDIALAKTNKLGGDFLQSRSPAESSGKEVFSHRQASTEGLPSGSAAATVEQHKPTPQQEKPGRMRLPPRSPLPRWDV